MQPVRFHHLKAVARAAQLGKFVMDSNEADVETYAMEKGTAVHEILFGTRPVVGYLEDKPRRGEAWEQFQLEHEGATILTASDYRRASLMADAVMRNDDAVRLLSGCVYEDKLQFSWLGRACRVTPDIRAPIAFPFARHIAELKTTRSAQPFEFMRDAERRHYHTQLAWQQIGVEEACGYRPTEAYIIAVESAPPFLTCVFELTPDRLDVGARTVRLWMERLVGCEQAGEWPGYSQSPVKWDAPEPLAFEDDDQEAA